MAQTQGGNTEARRGALRPRTGPEAPLLSLVQAGAREAAAPLATAAKAPRARALPRGRESTSVLRCEAMGKKAATTFRTA